MSADEKTKEYDTLTLSIPVLKLRRQSATKAYSQAKKDATSLHEYH